MMKKAEKLYPTLELEKLKRRKIITLIILLVLVILFFFISLIIGFTGLSILDVLKGIFGIETSGTNNVIIIQRIRLPRILGAIIVGWGLAFAGCTMQSVLKNPMASPSTLGVTNAAVFGANFAIIVLSSGYFGSTTSTSLFINNPYLIALFAFIFSLLSVFLILGLAKIRRFTPGTVVLAGVAIGSLFTALTTFVQYFAVDTQLSSAVFWSYGDLSRLSYSTLLVVFIIIVVCSLVLFLLRWSLNALSAGETKAKSLGVRTQLIRFISLFVASLMTAICVCFVGLIGFVGLIAPHIIKRFVGNDMKYLLPASGLTGSLVLLIGDTLSRVVIWGATLPVGVITTIFGVPVFIYILLSKKEKTI